MFKAKNLETVTLIQNLSVDLKQLVNLNQQYPPTHKWFKFISTLIDCIQTVEIGPSLNRQTDSKSFLIEQKLIDTSSELTQLKNEVRNKKTYKPIHEAGDLLRYNFAVLSFKNALC